MRGIPEETGVIDHPLTRQYDDYEFRAPDSVGEAQSALTRYRRLVTVELPYRVDRYPTSRYAFARTQARDRPPPPIASPPQAPRASDHRRRHLRQGPAQPAVSGIFGCHRMLLACLEMRLTHPVSGEPIKLSAPLSDDFASVLDALGWENRDSRSLPDQSGSHTGNTPFSPAGQANFTSTPKPGDPG